MTTILGGGVRQNRVKAKLAAGELVLGTMSQMSEPALPEIAGASGLDFFVIDMEHAAIAGQEVAHMTRAAQAAGITALIRVRSADEKTFLWVLDTGVEGLMVPLVEDAVTARVIYDLSHFPLDGNGRGSRTICSASRAAGHGAYRADLKPYIENTNRELVLIALLETPKAVANAKEIAKEPIDVLVVGRGDLSLKMGYPGGPSHPKVMDVSKRALSEVIEAGKTAGVMAYDLEEAQEWIRFGCRFVMYSEPEVILVRQYASALAAMRPVPVPA